MSTAQRRNVRKRVSTAVMVVNAISGDTMGRIGNLSIDGMMLISPQALKEEWLFQVHFQLAVTGQVRKIEVGMQCLWTEAARTAGSHWNGCKFIDIDEADRRHLKAWLDLQTETV